MCFRTCTEWWFQIYLHQNIHRSLSYKVKANDGWHSGYDEAVRWAMTWPSWVIVVYLKDGFLQLKASMMGWNNYEVSFHVFQATQVTSVKANRTASTRTQQTAATSTSVPLKSPITSLAPRAPTSAKASRVATGPPMFPAAPELLPDLLSFYLLSCEFHSKV